jgi:hypothetical protein
MPGYFTARDMGMAQNLTQGFSGMQNVMLELAGGVVADGSVAGAPQPGDIKIGPGTSNSTTAWVRPDLMGSSNGNNNKLYFVPDSKHWVSQNSAGQQVGIPENQQLRSVVDDFGNPFLAWTIDDTAVGQIKQEDQFGKNSLGNANDPSARFYWASNSAFLSANALGNRSYDQTRGAATLPYGGSMIGSTSASGNAPGVPPIDAYKSLCGLLGSPSFPYRPPSSNVGPTVPASARAPFIVQSAGPDGIFLGGKDRGAKQFTTGYVDYQLNFVNRSGGTLPNDAYHDKDGKVETIDVIKAFDDIIATGGN